MAAGPSLLDINTGLPVGNISPYARPTSEFTTTTTPGRVDITQQTQVTETDQAQTTLTNILNTTPEALRALNELIGQLSDKPAISDAELFAKAPNVQIQYSRTGWLYFDPRTQQYVSAQDAQRINAERAAEREVTKREAGVIRGGTESQRETEEQRKLEISRTRQQQGQYTKEAAFADAQFLIDRAIRDALEKSLPQITAASEGAGTSKGTFRALATQEAATEGAVEGGALGAQLGVQYGQIFNQLEALLLEMTKQDPNSPAALLIQALQTAKGSIQSGSTYTETSGRQVTQTQQQTQVGPTSQQQQVNRTYDLGGGFAGTMTGVPEVAGGARIVALPGQQQTQPLPNILGAVRQSDTFDTNVAYDRLIEGGFDEY